MEAIAEERLREHLLHLTQDVGVRLAGSEQEQRAAEYAAERFRAAGADVDLETFPMRMRDVQEERLEVRVNGEWRSFGCSLFSNTPGTGGNLVEAPLVFYEAPAERDRVDLSGLRGKAVVHLGCHIESRDAYRRLIEAAPAFMLFVDVRYPGAVPLADGMFPAYTDAIGALPVLNVAFMDAWEWKRLRADAARIRVRGGMRPARSQNVIAELPGREPERGTIYMGAHHDTQAGTVGADDNGGGVAGLLELCRVLAPRPRLRTIRLISFGAEEQLSVGSAEYVRRHRDEVTEQGRLMFNLDGYTSLMGWSELVCNGPRALEREAAAAFAAAEWPVRIDNQICPYADHFPFVAAGVPGLLLWRLNCTSGRFFHHRPDDDMTRVSTAAMRAQLEVVASFVSDMANRPDLPFGREIPSAQSSAVQRFWQDLFGGWQGRRVPG